MGGLLASLLPAALGEFFKALFSAWFGKREADAERADLDAAHERAGAAEAANETQQTISDIADARSKLAPGSVTPIDLARRMRERAAADRGAGRGGQDGSGR